MQVIRATNDAGECISFEEWMVLMDMQNSENTRVIPTTAWEEIKVR